MLSLKTLIRLGLTSVLFSAFVWANGSRPVPTPRADVPEKTPQQLAAEAYNQGLKLRDKAWKEEANAETAKDERAREKALDKAQKHFRNAIKEFRRAIKQVDDFHQAHSSLGYALRRTGDYESSLEAYNQALSFNPNYVEAIEYRAEAYLELNRLEDAKESYLQLFRQDRQQADTLLRAMKGWIERQGASTSESVQEFVKWVSEREGIAQTTGSADGGSSAW